MRKNGYNSIVRGIKVVLVLMLGIGVSCGLTSCFKKKKAAQQSQTSSITVKAPSVEGIKLTKIKLAATASKVDANQGKECKEAKVPEAGEWRNFSGADPYATVQLTEGCQYDFYLGFAGKKGDKLIVYEGTSSQVVSKDKDGKARIKVPISENSNPNSQTIEAVGEEEETPSSTPDTNKEQTIEVKKMKVEN